VPTPTLGVGPWAHPSFKVFVIRVHLPDAHFGDPKEHQVTDKELQSVGEVAIAYAQKESGSATLLPSGFFLRDNVLACRTGTTAHDLVSVIGKINEYRAAQRFDKFALRIECLFRAHEAKVYSIHSNIGEPTAVGSLESTKYWPDTVQDTQQLAIHTAA
jgi:hypothetical protein